MQVRFLDGQNLDILIFHMLFNFEEFVMRVIYALDIPTPETLPMKYCTFTFRSAPTSY